MAEAWERFHELLRRCPHHRLTIWMQVHTFYNGLRDRAVIDASVGGALMKKTTNPTYEILEDASTNTNQWPRDRITVEHGALKACNLYCFMKTIFYILFFIHVSYNLVNIRKSKVY